MKNIPTLSEVNKLDWRSLESKSVFPIQNTSVEMKRKRKRKKTLGLILCETNIVVKLANIAKDPVPMYVKELPLRYLKYTQIKANTPWSN